MKSSQQNTLSFLLPGIIMFAIIAYCNYSIYQYLDKLDDTNCKCAKLQLAKFLQTSSIIIPGIVLISLLISYQSMTSARVNPLLVILKNILSMYTMIYTICLIVYYFELKRCECANIGGKNFLLYPVFFAVGFIGFMLIMNVVGMFLSR